MEDGEKQQQIELDGVEVEETASPTAYKLKLFATGGNFLYLGRIIQGNAVLRSEEPQPLAYISYYLPAPLSEQAHRIFVSIWRSGTGYLVPDEERIIAGAEEAREMARAAMRESIKHFRELDKQMEVSPERVALEPA